MRSNEFEPWFRTIGTSVSAILFLIGLAGVPRNLTTWFKWLSILRTNVPWWGLIVASILLAALTWIPKILRCTKKINYRDVIKLIHKQTGSSLHSHNITCSHNNSSRQQQVTAFAGADPNDYWIVKKAHGCGEFEGKGSPVTNRDIIRLEHRSTRKNLHSHKSVPSPLTGQQEVTAYGIDGIGDENDNWRIDVENGGKWRENVAIRLIHVRSGCALHSHAGHSHPQFTAGQQEVACYSDRDANDIWFAIKVHDDGSG